ncbi:DUF4982 domain-containing protein [Actinospica sp. MGRD01-02]|uniref:DUF4982 domain-containing protein n=1 Tax=Actinospica acidithermotolerans TaxID=2828514 RepID=A0A941EE89_9ACTN|nr:glycoside hydrolase family 2 TIM barrel-domain containing protein [Actinospica acidithermotolerans]MBR7828862.1 DUF4982 domain-containing protein [Actinospica acidithermotolerans]
MTIESFNTGWTVRTQASVFEQVAGPSVEPPPVTLPHDALISQERAPENGPGRAFFPSGCFLYEKAFEAPEEWRTKRVAVEFQGVYRDAAVFVNDVAAYHRPYGYSWFQVELDPYLRYGQTNTIRVEARSHLDSRWYTGAGIYRDTRLIVCELVHIASHGLRVTTPDIDAERAVVETAVEVRNDGLSTETVELTVQISDETGAVVAAGSAPVTTRAGHSTTARVRTYVYEPKLWSPDTPHLYTATATLRAGEIPIDTRRTGFGVRTLQVDPRHGLRINGESVKLRGACVHHDNGILGAAAIGRAEQRKVELLKQAGFNAIRSAHNPLSDAMLEACDRVGMLVMDEAFDVWTVPKSQNDYTLAFPEWWERDIEAMVAKDLNHPSVIMYSIGNEIPETGDRLGAELGRRLAEKIRSLDSTRFVTNGINGMVSTFDEVAKLVRETRRANDANPDAGVNELMAAERQMQHEHNMSQVVTDRTAESFSVLDIAGINYGDSRYELDKKLFPNRVIVGSETFPRRIAEAWPIVLANPHVIGDFTWTGLDYLGEVGVGRAQYTDTPHRFEASFPWITAWCGDLDITGYRRPASYFREIVFGLSTEPYIAVQDPDSFERTRTDAPWSWSESIASWTWAAKPGTPIRVEVYSDADEIELLLDGEIIARRPVGEKEALTALFDIAYQPGELAAVAYRDGRETGRRALRSADGATRLTATAERAALEASDSDLAYIAIELRDANGTLVTCDDRRVRVTVEGAGILQGLGSARPDNTERYDSAEHTTFHGRALAVVRPTGAGSITVSVETDGQEPVLVRLSAI